MWGAGKGLRTGRSDFSRRADSVSDTHILVVEDQRAVAGALRMRLRGLGYDVLDIAKDGAEAVEKAGALRPDLILMDIRLGDGIDGIEAAQQIRAQFDIPIVYVTAYADYDLLDRARATHPAGFINKPFTTKDLLTTINLALHQERDDDGAAVTAEQLPREAVVTADRDGQISFLSEGAERITGWPRVSAIGRPLASALTSLYPLLEAAADKLVHAVIVDGEEHVLHRRDTHPGKPGDVLGPLSDSAGKRFGAVLRFGGADPAVNLGAVQRVADAFSFVLEKSPLGLVLLDDKLAITHINAQARDIVTANREMQLNSGFLQIVNADRHDALRRTVERVANAEDDASAAELVLLDDGEEIPRIFAIASAVPASGNEGETPLVALMMFDLKHRRRLSASILRELYGLTRSESRLVQCLVGGSSLEDGAAELGISVNTARTHLKHIFHKTGARRQSELIHQVETGPASLAVDLGDRTPIKRSNKAR